MSTEAMDGFCEHCGVALDLHVASEPGDDRCEWDCASAEAKARLIERWPFLR